MKSRLAVIVILIGALLATAGARQWAIQRRAAAMRIPGQAPGTVAGGERASLASMNSYALALLLGGLRGPLVMILWQQSEAQKNAKDLEGVDTMIEWIRLLQPEFDTVHLFQIWNKAYNISVQMASLTNKYAVILDAIEYARSLDREKPNDINIIHAIGQTFFDKLGNSAEKDYYRRRVREETMYRPEPKNAPRQVGYRSNRLDPMLDVRGYLLADLVTATIPRPADLPDDSPWNNGAPMQYLEPYQPFPQGVSPFAIAYDYFKRAQVLQRVSGQRHIQVSDMVVDSRPALALKAWSEAEWERGRRFELGALGLSVPTERLEMEPKSADIAVTSVFKNPDDAGRALYSYQMAHRLALDALPQYEQHLKLYANNLTTYESHMEHLRGVAALTEADRLYLEAMLTEDADRRSALLGQARSAYAQSIHRFDRLVLRYFTDDNILQAILPRGIVKTTVAQIPDQRLDGLMARRAQYVQQAQRGQDMHAEDVAEYMTYVARARQRIGRIDAFVR